jgi:hypothetical protein
MADLIWFTIDLYEGIEVFCEPADHASFEFEKFII